MTVTLTPDEIAKLNETDATKRYFVVYNGTNSTIYPALIGYDENNNILTDVDKNNLPSGFILEPKKYKILTFPKYVISGRIIARTGCKSVPGLYGTGLDGLLCDTGDCHQSYDPSSGKPEDVTYNVSDKGLLCNIKGGQAPATILEFSFTRVSTKDSKGKELDANTDYYDVSQVDGNNMSAQMEPIRNQNPKTPNGVDSNYWCQKAGCTAKLDCPPEMRVYDDNGKWIACQSICAAMGGIGTNFAGDRKTNTGPQHYLGPPPGPFNNFTGNLLKNDQASYNKLVDMWKTNYYWDQTTSTWLPDKDESKCPLTCTGNPQTCTVPTTCISTEDLVCCRAKNGNSCGPPPQFNGPSDQGCSPYVTSYKGDSYIPHLCKSENWPVASDGQKYNEVLKKHCPGAYSWAFDDLSSTFTCNSVSDTPVHYFVQFYDYNGTPDTLGPETGPTKSFWTLEHILMIAGGALLLILILVIIFRRQN